MPVQRRKPTRTPTAERQKTIAERRGKRPVAEARKAQAIAERRRRVIASVANELLRITEEALRKRVAKLSGFKREEVERFSRELKRELKGIDAKHVDFWIRVNFLYFFGQLTIKEIKELNSLAKRYKVHPFHILLILEYVAQGAELEKQFNQEIARSIQNNPTLQATLQKLQQIAGQRNQAQIEFFRMLANTYAKKSY
ncbi:MAG: hypothetical protein J7L14_01435 [Candidatus Diapherotrites archaeon]|nr:hypothetical protein [Candidatus Diapherotrites archaeon]